MLTHGVAEPPAVSKHTSLVLRGRGAVFGPAKFLRTNRRDGVMLGVAARVFCSGVVNVAVGMRVEHAPNE